MCCSAATTVLLWNSWFDAEREKEERENIIKFLTITTVSLCLETTDRKHSLDFVKQTWSARVLWRSIPPHISFFLNTQEKAGKERSEKWKRTKQEKKRRRKWQKTSILPYTPTKTDKLPTYNYNWTESKKLDYRDSGRSRPMENKRTGGGECRAGTGSPRKTFALARWMQHEIILYQRGKEWGRERKRKEFGNLKENGRL